MKKDGFGRPSKQKRVNRLRLNGDFPGIVPYGVATLVLALAYARFVRELPKDTRARFVTAGVIFLTGALGNEMPGAREADLHGTETVVYCLLFNVIKQHFSKT